MTALEMNIKQNKNVLREQARIHRGRMEIDGADFEHVIEAFFNYFNQIEGLVVTAYWPMGKEFDVRFLLDELVKRGVQVALPVIEQESLILKFHEWSPNAKMKAGAYGVMEPVGTKALAPDLILAPLLAFDQKGHRLGQGGGYYDATLAHYRAQKELTYIGVGYSEQAVLFDLPTEGHDQKLDYILTPQEVRKFVK